MNTRLIIEDEETGAPRIVERILPVPEYTLGQMVGYKITRNETVIKGDAYVESFSIDCFVTDVDAEENIEFDWDIRYTLSDGYNVSEADITHFWPEDEEEE